METTAFGNLLKPMKIGNVVFKNRMCVAPMGAGYGNRMGPRGEYNDNAIEYMVERARGGYGLYFAGSIYPDTKVEKAEGDANFMLHQVDFKKRALRMTERASFYDMKMIQQISFGTGRNEGGLSCSPNPVFGKPGVIARELTRDEIKQKIECVVNCAKLMKDCGFVGVEMHAMHWGYLLDQFSMSLFNHRTDEYGGCLENRLRIAKELAEGIKQVCGQDFLLSMRMGLKSYVTKDLKADFTGEHEAGRTIEESIRIAKLLEQYGYDMLDVNAGIYESFYYACAPLYIDKGYAIPLAEQVKKEVNIPILCGSRVDDPVMSEKAIAEGKIDAVVMGRPSLADPEYAKKVESGKTDKIRPCIGCLVGCMGKIRSGQYMACAVNPLVMREDRYAPQKALQPKKVAVIGGGVAGMEVARTAALRGHEVTVYEADNRLGGNLNPAGAHDFKKEIRDLRDWYVGELEDLRIPVHYGKKLSVDEIRDLDADAIVLATGSEPVKPRIEGIDHPKCITGVDALNEHDANIGQEIVIIGGGLVGCETALDFAKQGKHVTLVEAADKILSRSEMIPLMVTQAVPDLLEHYHVTLKEGYMIKAVNDTGAVIVPSAGGEEETLAADHVVMSVGMKSRETHLSELYGCRKDVFVVGDAKKVGNVYTSVHSAYEIARSI